LSINLPELRHYIKATLSAALIDHQDEKNRLELEIQEKELEITNLRVKGSLINDRISNDRRALEYMDKLK